MIISPKFESKTAVFNILNYQYGWVTYLPFHIHIKSRQFLIYDIGRRNQNLFSDCIDDFQISMYCTWNGQLQ